jgi:site-specific recombinase XerD
MGDWRPSGAEAAKARGCGREMHLTLLFRGRAAVKLVRDVQARLAHTEARMETQWINRWGSWICAKPVKPGIFRRKDGGFLIRGRVTDPRIGKIKEIRMTLLDVDALGAFKRLQEELASVRNGLAPTNPRQRIRFTEYAASLFERKVKKGKIKSARTRQKWESELRLHLAPAFGELFIDAIRRADIEKWLGNMADEIEAKRLHPGTAHTRFATLRNIMNAAACEFEWERNPTFGLESFSLAEHPTYTDEEPNSLTVEEVPRFLSKMREKYPQFFAATALGFATGLRPSSLRPLRRRGEASDVQWDQNILLVRRSHTVGQEVMNTTKTGKRQKLFLPVELMDVLKWHVANLKLEEQVQSDLLFPSRNGAYQGHSILHEPFREVAKAINLKKTISPRAMRRTYQDLARAAEIKDIVTRSISGHATEAMQERYSTVQIEEMRTSIGKIISIAKVKEALAA